MRMCTALKSVNQINTIGEMNKFMKFNCSLCMEECLIISKNLHTKSIILMKKPGDIQAIMSKYDSASIFPKHQKSPLLGESAIMVQHILNHFVMFLVTTILHTTEF